MRRNSLINEISGAKLEIKIALQMHGYKQATLFA